MRTVVVFYAWQSDRPNNVNRGFIERALEDAARQLSASLGNTEIVIDKDTQGVSGMPPITETILDKIRNCDIFLPDLTFVARIEDGPKQGQPCPNSNVLIEFGHALSAKGHAFLVPVMNTAFGGPDGLPFDMGHLRHPITYSASPSDEVEARRKERARLSSALAVALKTAIDNLPATPAPTDLVKLMRERVAEKQALQTNLIYQMTPVPLIGGPKLLMHILPESAFDESQEIDFSIIPRQLRNFVPFQFERLYNQSDTHSWHFFDPPASEQKRLFPGRVAPKPGQSMWFTEISRFGLVELVAMIDTIGMPEDSGPIAINGSMLEALIVRTVETLFGALDALEVEPPAILACTLLEVRDCHIIEGRAYGRFRRQPIALPEVTLHQFSSPIAGELRPMLDAIWRSAGVGAGSPSYTNSTWAGYG